MNHTEMLQTILNQQNETNKELKKVRTELGEEIQTLEGKLDLFTEQTINAFSTLSGKIDIMDEKLEKSVVSKFEHDFVTEKIHTLEKEIFKLKHS